MQLLLDILVHAHGGNTLYVTRCGAEGQPVKHVQRLNIGGREGVANQQAK